MKKYVLLVETGADMPADLADRFGIYQVPMHVSFGVETRDDGAIPIHELFSYYEKTGMLPKTSGCTPSDFEKIFDEIHTQHPDSHIIHLAYSAATTCSYQSAVIAAEERDYITSIDTKHVSAGQTMTTLAVMHYIRQNPDCTPEDIIEAVALIRKNCQMAFFPGDLAYLKAGGRVSNAAYLGAKILSLNPLIEVNDGLLQATKKYRGSIQKVAPKMLQDYAVEKNLDKRLITLVYSEGLDEALKNTLTHDAENLGFEKILWMRTGCVVSSHSGPGAFGVCGFAENEALNRIFSSAEQ
ncbi:MAG: DegV family protein [Eubacteriales bacterium]|nr:DegV family protein [Eubacteriales bacterium]